MSTIHKIVGPPGTGKTTFLARQAHLAADRFGGEQVAIISLTRAAATEIGGRDTAVPSENCSTLHAACYRALDRPALAETKDAMKEFSASQSHYVLNNTISDRVPEDDPEPYARYAASGADDGLHAAVANHRARMTPRRSWSEDEREYANIWDDFKRQTGRLDFTDLIEHCLEQGIGHPATPRVLLLDEAQDFSRLELALAQRWASECDTAVVVGDTDQALYTWRGSDPSVIDNLPSASERVLEQSYRVPAAAHAAAISWVGQIAGRRPVAYRPTDYEGHVGRSHLSLRNPADLADLAADAADSGETMVLTSCGYMLEGLVHHLRGLGVPFHNPYRATAGNWNPMRAAPRLAAFLRPLGDVWGDGSRMWTWGDLQTWTEPLSATRALARGSKAAIDEHCRQDQFGESRANQPIPLDTLITLLGSEDHPALNLDVDWWEGCLRANKVKTHAYPLAVYRARGGRALVQTPQLVVGTIHAAKGTEADHVILAPDLSPSGFWEGWHRGGPRRDAIVRMGYVALTRARQTVTVLAPSGPEHMPVDLLAPEAEMRLAA